MKNKIKCFSLDCIVFGAHDRNKNKNGFLAVRPEKKPYINVPELGKVRHRWVEYIWK